MSAIFPGATTRNPITLPDGSAHQHTVFLNQVIDHPNIGISDYTYYTDFDPVTDYAAQIAPYIYPGAPERLTIGRFCQLAHGTRFITSSANHSMAGYSTYPFRVFNPASMGAYSAEVARHGDTVVGHDVWFGYQSLIMPGVQIGNGAIIAARSVVARDIPAYAIAAGNPARVKRRRFDDAVIARLESLAWWHWPIEKIAEHFDDLTTGHPRLLKLE